MSRTVRRGLPPVPTALVVPAEFFAAIEPAARVTVLPDVPLVPARSLLSAALAADQTGRAILWASGSAPFWDTVASALGADSAIASDIRATVAALSTPTLLIVELDADVPARVDSELVALLRESELLQVTAICTGRRDLEGLARLEGDTNTVAPAAMVLDGAGIHAFAHDSGYDLDESDAASLALTPLALPDVLPAVFAAVTPSQLEGREDVVDVLLDETDYQLGLRLRLRDDDALAALIPIAVPESLSARGAANVDARTLDAMAQAGLLLRGNGGAHLTLQPALRRAVLAEVTSRLPEQVAAVDARLASDLLENGDVLAAITHLMRAELWDDAIAALDDSILTLLAEHEDAAHTVILSLPRRVRDENPRLSLWLELSWAGEHDATLTATRKAAAALTRLPDVMSPWDRLHATLTRTLVLRLKGDYAASIDAARALDVLLDGDEMADRPARTLAEAHYQSGMSRLLGLDLVGARESFGRSYELAQGTDPRAAVRAAEATALTRALEGEAEQATVWLRTLESGTSGTAGLVARALLAIGRLDARDTRHWLARLADLRAGDEFWVFAVHAANRYGLYWGDPVETDADLDRAWAEHGDQLVPGSTAQVLLTSDAADLALLNGQLSRAETALDQCTTKNTWISVTRARLALLASNPKHALLAILDGQSRGRTERYGQLDLAVLRAAAELALDRREDATASLLRAVNQAEKSGVIVPFHLLPRETLSDLAELHPDAKLFVARHQLVGTSYLAPYQAAAGALSERELVVLRALDPGATIEQIAKKLFVASNTVKAQLRSIYRKLGVSTRTEALLVAAELGLLGEDSRTA